MTDPTNLATQLNDRLGLHLAPLSAFGVGPDPDRVAFGVPVEDLDLIDGLSTLLVRLRAPLVSYTVRVGGRPISFLSDKGWYRLPATHALEIAGEMIDGAFVFEVVPRAVATRLAEAEEKETTRKTSAAQAASLRAQQRRERALQPIDLRAPDRTSVPAAVGPYGDVEFLAFEDGELLRCALGYGHSGRNQFASDAEWSAHGWGLYVSGELHDGFSSLSELLAHYTDVYLDTDDYKAGRPVKIEAVIDAARAWARLPPLATTPKSEIDGDDSTEEGGFEGADSDD